MRDRETASEPDDEREDMTEIEEDDEPGAVPDDDPGAGGAAEPDGAGEAARGDGEPSRIEALEAQVADLRDQLLRKQADLVNFRRRMERDRRERAERARADLLRDLLPLVDDFERAAVDDSGNLEAYREGVTLILDGLRETLRRLGVERIEPVGEPFDPAHHEAVEQTATDEVPAGHVVSVYKPGYRMGDRLLRAAMVGVATAPPESEQD